MQFYSRYWPDCYEELITYYPRFYREVREMVAILHAHGHMADGAQDAIERTFLNAFVLEADEATIKKWEGVLGIIYTKSLTLEQRRRVVYARLNSGSHVGEPEIRQMVGAYTDCGITVDFDSGIIYVDIDGEIFDEGNLYESLLGRIPAHLGLMMTARTIREFRQVLPLCFGGAIGQEMQGQPVGRDRTASETLVLAQGAFLASSSDIEPSAAKTRQEQALSLSFGSYTASDSRAAPHGEDREQRTEMPLTAGGAFGTERQDEPLPAEHTEKAGHDGSGGFYIRSHITSSLIKEEHGNVTGEA